MLQCSAGRAGEGKPQTLHRGPDASPRAEPAGGTCPGRGRWGRTRPQPGAGRDDPAERAAGGRGGRYSTHLSPPCPSSITWDQRPYAPTCPAAGEAAGVSPPRAGQARAEAAAAAAVRAPAAPLRPKLPRPAAARWLGWALPRGAFLLRLPPPPSSSSSSSSSS